MVFLLFPFIYNDYKNVFYCIAQVVDRHNGHEIINGYRPYSVMTFKINSHSHDKAHINHEFQTFIVRMLFTALIHFSKFHLLCSYSNTSDDVTKMCVILGLIMFTAILVFATDRLLLRVAVTAVNNDVFGVI